MYLGLRGDVSTFPSIMGSRRLSRGLKRRFSDQVVEVPNSP